MNSEIIKIQRVVAELEALDCWYFAQLMRNILHDMWIKNEGMKNESL